VDERRRVRISDPTRGIEQSSQEACSTFSLTI
jgi:hypothetical protein